MSYKHTLFPQEPCVHPEVRKLIELPPSTSYKVACESEERKPQGDHHGEGCPDGDVLELYNGKEEGGKQREGVGIRDTTQKHPE